MRALILAAGLGTRLKPLTNKWPKCLMPIGGRPLLEYWFQTLRAEGVSELIVNAHHHADLVKEFIAREHFSKWVKMVHEPELLGTAGTLQANADFFRGHTTLLLHADNWCQCDFGSFVNFHFNQRPSNCLISMMTFDTTEPESCGIVEINDQGVVIGFHEKVAKPLGKRANGAVYILHPDVISWLDNQNPITDFSTQVLPKFIGSIATWHNYGIHRDIGNIKALRAAQCDPIPQHFWPGTDDWQRNFESLSIFGDLLKDS